MKAKKYQPLVIKYPKGDGTQGEYPLGCGNSLEDVMLIITFYILFFVFLTAYFCLLLTGAIQTDESHVILWSFFYFGIFFSVGVAGAVYMGMKEVDKENEQRRSLEEIRLKESKENA